MKTLHTAALTTLAAAMAAGSAFAQQPTAPPPAASPQPMEARDHDRDHDKKPSYDQLNARGDGRVTRADLAEHPRMLEKFDDIDTSGDGSISRDEYEAWKSDKKDDKDRGSRY